MAVDEHADAWMSVTGIIFGCDVERFALILAEKNLTENNGRKFLTPKSKNEPSHEIMVLFVLHKLILQMHMHNHPVGLDL